MTPGQAALEKTPDPAAHGMRGVLGRSLDQGNWTFWAQGLGMKTFKALLAVPACRGAECPGLDGGNVLETLQRRWLWGSKAENWSMAAAPASQDQTGPRGQEEVGRDACAMHPMELLREDPRAAPTHLLEQVGDRTTPDLTGSTRPVSPKNMSDH